MKSPSRRFVLSVLGIALTSAPAIAAPDAKDIEFFRKKIQPIFTEHCYKCHSHGDKIKGGLVVDSLSARPNPDQTIAVQAVLRAGGR